MVSRTRLTLKPASAASAARLSTSRVISLNLLAPIRRRLLSSACVTDPTARLDPPAAGTERLQVGDDRRIAAVLEQASFRRRDDHGILRDQRFHEVLEQGDVVPVIG